MSLFTESVMAEIFHEFGEREKKQYQSFRHAKRAVLAAMNDNKSDVYGAGFTLLDGSFLKEIHFF